MRTLLKLPVVGFLLIASATCCSALTVIMDVSKEQAEEWNMVVKSRPDGDAGHRIWMEFEIEGKWEKFSSVVLIMSGGLGEQLARIPISVARRPSGKVVAGFSAQVSVLEKCEFWVYANDIAKGGSAYRLRLAEFVDLKAFSADGSEGSPEEPAGVGEGDR